MTTTLVSQPRSRRRRDLVGLVATGLAWVAALAMLVPTLRVPPYVDQITIDNPHPWAINVDVTNGGDGWVGIGPVDRDGRSTFHGVVDQGGTWIFTFTYAGEHAQLRISRQQLQRDNWEITVPDEVAEQLRAAGVPETPR